MGEEVLSESEVEKSLKDVPEWKLEGDAIGRELTFADFREVVSFLVLIAFDAEQADHHPDVKIQYKRLHLTLSTHSAGGLTDKDFHLARIIDKHFEAKG